MKGHHEPHVAALLLYPLYVTVEVNNGYRVEDGYRATLTGLSEVVGHLMAHLHPHPDTSYYNWKTQAKNCKLVLRPFSDLARMMEDGTVPALEVAKMWGLPGETAEVLPNGHILVTSCQSRPALGHITDQEPQAPFQFTITPEHLRGVGKSINFKSADYLRALHFPVGLPDGAYITAAAAEPTAVQ